jgi:quercetin dioxygenase-like cupin family protein
VIPSSATKYVRTVDFREFQNDGCEWQTLYFGEGCRIRTVSLASAATTPPKTHAVDELVYLLSGSLCVQLDSDVVACQPDTLLYVPAGIPHGSWNPGGENTLHLEVLAPAPEPGGTSEVIEPAPERRHLVRPLASVDVDTQVFLERRFMLGLADGCESMTVYHATVPPGGAHPGLHVHDRFDMFYYVLEGQLSVQIGLDEDTLGPHGLAVLPAGVPHRLWNATGSPVRQLSLITPAARPGIRADIGVSFSRADQ